MVWLVGGRLGRIRWRFNWFGLLAVVYWIVQIHTYRFQSGLGGDISVQELMMESQLCFVIPQQLL